MIPITNEPHGENENQKRNDADLISNENNDINPIDQTSNNISGNASGNVEAEESEEHKVVVGKGFMGDFAQPQHDE